MHSPAAAGCVHITQSRAVCGVPPLNTSCAAYQKVTSCHAAQSAFTQYSSRHTSHTQMHPAPFSASRCGWTWHVPVIYTHRTFLFFWALPGRA